MFTETRFCNFVGTLEKICGKIEEGNELFTGR